MATTIIEKAKPVTSRISARARVLAILAAVAAAVTTADQPFAAIAGAGAVILASEVGRRIR